MCFARDARGGSSVGFSLSSTDGSSMCLRIEETFKAVQQKVFEGGELGDFTGTLQAVVSICGFEG
jgi:hypothetical protein